MLSIIWWSGVCRCDWGWDWELSGMFPMGSILSTHIRGRWEQSQNEARERETWPSFTDFEHEKRDHKVRIESDLQKQGKTEGKRVSWSIQKHPWPHLDVSSARPRAVEYGTFENDYETKAGLREERTSRRQRCLQFVYKLEQWQLTWPCMGNLTRQRSELHSHNLLWRYPSREHPLLILQCFLV